MAAGELFEALREMFLVVGEVVADRRESLEVAEHILDGGDGIMALGSMTGVVNPDIFKNKKAGNNKKLVIMENGNNNGR